METLRVSHLPSGICVLVFFVRMYLAWFINQRAIMDIHKEMAEHTEDRMQMENRIVRLNMPNIIIQFSVFSFNT